MGFAENRGSYWRGRYKTAPGRYATVKDASGRVVKFRNRRAAEQAADEKEAEVRAGLLTVVASGQMLFSVWANTWYAEQDLAASTMQNYRRHIENHLLPAFGHLSLEDIDRAAVAEWEKAERAAGYAELSIKTWRATLHLILGDAVERGLQEVNPAARRRGRGRRDGRQGLRGKEKTVTTALGILLIAERAALLSGRDDEFVAVVTKGYTGMRFGELVGLEAVHVRQAAVRVEWQLYELDSGVLERCPPKDGSRRTIDSPSFLAELLTDHVSRVRPQPCPCHGLTYAFRGHGLANGAARAPGPKLVDVARLAGVSTGTVSNVLNRPDTVPEVTRAKVDLAVADLGYVRGAVTGDLAPHWRRSGFGTWLFEPAATGRYPARAPHPGHPVPILGEPWPGVPVRGRGAAARADACWVPVALGLTPHGLRHTHKTLMEELGTPSKLMDDRMGHDDGSVQARYSHITDGMRRRLLEGLTEMWQDALETRRRFAAGSPVVVLDRLLRKEVGE
ncbi:LacI family DNA-binding transcriptional regulator [Actinoplanes awajinensis]|uniref:LacI family transcriptional regulator n=1 Tax=Actinoplanes awajinensis subsp. mycoplanecinus TaxID=135947 RepID=A0A124G991_9ACTN|nr:LacI family DNA-binding transcriptional regulator [Actinoplanes awajinensis]KUL28376.1 LacI family transcriptional regulator [Actinoplanes awajinensis subsp. mycoplanecinus]